MEKFIDNSFSTCRLCMYKSKTAKFVPIFREHDEKILQNLRTHLNIEVKRNDTFPTIICLKCNETLNQWNEFYELCHSVQEYLRNEIISECEARKDVSTDVDDCIKETCKLPDTSEHITSLPQANIAHNIKPTKLLLKTKTPTICDLCGKLLSSHSTLKTHLKTHSQVRTYSCPICPYKGRTNAALSAHKSKHSTCQLLCDLCPKKFQSKKHLRDHLRRTHPSNKQHKCKICTNCFLDKYQLQVHMRSHTGVKPYVCQICGKGFGRSDSLKEHSVVHEVRETVVCRECGKEFLTKRGLTRHNCKGS